MSDIRQASRDFFIEFIELYKSFPCLWQIKHKDYSDRNKKDLAYVELINKYREVDPAADRAIVVKKINSFRTVYKKEVGKINRSLKSGAGANEVYKPKLWYFELLHFLNYIEPSRKSTSTIDESDEETMIEVQNDELEDQASLNVSERSETHLTGTTQCVTPSIPSTSLSLPNKRKLHVVETAMLETMKRVGDKLNSVKESDPHDIFGKHVADRLRNLKPHQLKFAQKLISDVLFEADMESLNRFCRITGTVDPVPQYSGHTTS
ncbi:uncharacterized protein LOC128985353 [Macrosteles quadrilineatus]|uniref:uncharacterized protein LOC128985353 n=1 Tax=Macrosteles quadrilineatus TaxID=74068 RepID=UPI0023E33816|nr:uncharacterized protein LOC128985353 [Macrosteles quadrilineatus]